MSMLSVLFGIASGFVLLALFLYEVFGQITVRKLRKNPNTKDSLGTEFASGWDIINVAQALAIPKTWAQKLRNSLLSVLYADVDSLYKYTSKFDRVLAFILYWLLISSVATALLLILLDAMGIID